MSGKDVSRPVSRPRAQNKERILASVRSILVVNHDEAGGLASSSPHLHPAPDPACTCRGAHGPSSDVAKDGAGLPPLTPAPTAVMSVPLPLATKAYGDLGSGTAGFASDVSSGSGGAGGSMIREDSFFDSYFDFNFMSGSNGLDDPFEPLPTPSLGLITPTSSKSSTHDSGVIVPWEKPAALPSCNAPGDMSSWSDPISDPVTALDDCQAIDSSRQSQALSCSLEYTFDRSDSSSSQQQQQQHQLARSQGMSRPRASRRLTEPSSTSAGPLGRLKIHRAHSVIERRYRTGLQDKFKALRDCVAKWKQIENSDSSGELDDDAASMKMNKASVLTEAVACIDNLKEENEYVFSQLEAVIEAVKSSRRKAAQDDNPWSVISELAR